MIRLDPDIVVPLMIFAVPIVAIIGGITAGIVRTLGRQRLAELAQRERIAAIERGLDPSKLPPPPSIVDDSGDFYLSARERDARRAQGLMIGGIITVFAAIGLIGLFVVVRPDRNNVVWAVGLVPLMIGAGLLLSALLVRPRGNGGEDAPRVP